MRWYTCLPDRLHRCLKDDLWPHMAAFADHLTEMLKFQQPDVVHAHFWMSAWASARAARRLNLPLLVTFHALGSVKRRYQGPADTSPLNRIRVEVAVAGAADSIVATATEEVRELALLGVPSSRCRSCPVVWIWSASLLLRRRRLRQPYPSADVAIGC